MATSSQLSRRDVLRALGVTVGAALGGCTAVPPGDDTPTVTPAPVPTASPTRSTPTAPPTETPDGGRFEQLGDCEGSTVPPGRERAGWPMAGHDAGGGGYNPAASLPGARPALDWSFDLGSNEVYSTPPAIGDDVYLGRTAYEGGSHVETTVHALDRRSGVEQWRVTLAYEHVTPPAYDSTTGTVYVVAGQDHDRAGPGHGEVRALAASTGEERWRFTVPRELVGGPVLAEGVVLVANSTFDSTAVHALETTTGEEAWRFHTGPEPPRAPTVSGDTVYVTRHGPELCAVDVADGTERWCREVRAAVTRPVVGPGVVYLGDRLGLTAYCAGSGSVAWRWAVSEPTTPAAAQRGVNAEPVVADDRLYATTHDTSPFHVGGHVWLYALDPAGDGRDWRTDLGQGGRAIGLADGVVAERALDGGHEAVAFRADGSAAWRLPDAGAPLAASADRLLAAGESRLQAFALG